MPDVKGAADKGKGALTRKVGPLPLWGWAVAGVGAVVVAKKLTGRGGGSAGPGLVTIPAIGSGGAPGTSPGGTAVVSPAQNVIGGADTAPAGVAPWWSQPLRWQDATPSVPLNGPSTNGSVGHGGPVGVPLPIAPVPVALPIPQVPVAAAPVSRPLPVPQIPNPVQVPVVNAPTATTIVSRPSADQYQTPGGAVAPGQQEVARVPGAGGGWLSIFGRTPA